MIRSRLNYWSCSKLADFIRGERKPPSLGWSEWDEWHENAKKKRPIRYWIAETGLKSLQNLVYYPVDVCRTIKMYVLNRWVDKVHYLKTGLKPGSYWDFDTRILHGLFNELVIFVERDLAALSCCQDKKYTFKNGRCVEAAYDYFDWATNLKYDEDHGVTPDDIAYGRPTQQAKDAIKIKDLYEWWTLLRPIRLNPYEIITEETHGQHCYRIIDDVQRRDNREDTEKLIELIMIRGALWT